jgi:crossover junction endodeoxyribonuclease RuvC
LDPGLNITGYGVIDLGGDGSIAIVEAGVLRTRRAAEIGRRLSHLHEAASELLGSVAPDAVALEQLYTHYERPTTAILMAHARGVLCLAAAQHNRPVFDYSATQIKRILTGSGRATKSQMQAAVVHELRLLAPPDPPDVADALAVALCHVFLNRRTIEQP